MFCVPNCYGGHYSDVRSTCLAQQQCLANAHASLYRPSPSPPSPPSPLIYNADDYFLDDNKCTDDHVLPFILQPRWSAMLQYFGASKGKGESYQRTIRAFTQLQELCQIEYTSTARLPIS